MLQLVELLIWRGAHHVFFLGVFLFLFMGGFEDAAQILQQMLGKFGPSAALERWKATALVHLRRCGKPVVQVFDAWACLWFVWFG